MYITKSNRKPGNASGSNLTNAGRRGRPMKRASELAPARKALASSAQVLQAEQVAENKNTTTAITLSRFERLPLEIIQQIFFLSLEVNLPRSSTCLSQALSNPAIYRSVTLLAFFPDDKASPVETYHFLPAEYRPLSPPEQQALQEAIVNCKWFTYDHFCSCLSTLFRLKMVQEWHIERDAESKAGRPPVIEPNKHFPDDELELLAQLPALTDQKAVKAHFSAWQSATVVDNFPFYWTSNNYDLPSAYRVGITTWYLNDHRHFEDHGKRPMGKHLDESHLVSIVAILIIPEAAIRCRTTDRVNLLRLLVAGSRLQASIDWDYFDVLRPMVLPETLFDAMAIAIKKQKYSFLLVLLDLYTVYLVSYNDVPESSDSHFRTHSDHPLPLALFYLAIEQESGDWRFLSALIRGWMYSIPCDDKRLTAWALHKWADQCADAKAKTLASWLLQFMVDPQHEYRLNFEYVFRYGKVNQYLFKGAFDASHLEVFLPARTFGDEISKMEDAWSTISDPNK